MCGKRVSVGWGSRRNDSQETTECTRDRQGAQIFQLFADRLEHPHTWVLHRTGPRFQVLFFHIHRHSDDEDEGKYWEILNASTPSCVAVARVRTGKCIFFQFQFLASRRRIRSYEIIKLYVSVVARK